jgi:hypothetical protein
MISKCGRLSAHFDMCFAAEPLALLLEMLGDAADLLLEPRDGSA